MLRLVGWWIVTIPSYEDLAIEFQRMLDVKMTAIPVSEARLEACQVHFFQKVPRLKTPALDRRILAGEGTRRMKKH